MSWFWFHIGWAVSMLMVAGFCAVPGFLNASGDAGLGVLVYQMLFNWIAVPLGLVLVSRTPDATRPYGRRVVPGSVGKTVAGILAGVGVGNAAGLACVH